LAFYDKRLPKANNSPTNPLLEPLNNYLAANMPGNTNYWTVNMRLDAHISMKHRVFFRGTVAHYWEDARDWLFSTEKGLASWDADRPRRNAVVDWTYTVNPSTVLNVNVSADQAYNRNARSVMMSYKPTDVGLPKYMDDKCTGVQGCALPRMAWSGYSEMASSVDSILRNRTQSLQSNLSHIRGSHTFRAGIDFRQGYVTTTSGGGNTSGLFSFSNTYTRKDEDGSAPAGTLGLSYAAYMLGIPSSISVDTNSSSATLTPFYGWYVEDTWRLTRNLTITPGLRFEYEGGATERYNQALIGWDAAYKPPIADAAAAAYAKAPLTEVPVSSFQTYGGTLYANKDGAPRSYWKGELMWLPRLSAAWQFNPKMILRGGYGIFFNPHGAPYSWDQTGYSRSTSTTVSNDFGQTWNFPAAANPANGNTPLKDPFPVRFDGTRFDVPYGNALGKNAYLGSSFSYTKDLARKHTRVQRWRIGVQRQLSANMVVEAAYWGQWADRLGVGSNLRALPGSYWATGMVRNDAIASNLNSNVTNPFQISNFASLATSDPLLYQRMSTSSFFTSSTVQKNRLLRPGAQNMSGLSTTDYIGKARSHSLELTFERRFSKGLSLNASYTRAKGENWTSIINEFETAPRMWLPTNNPIPHRLIITAIYELPIGKGQRFLTNGILSHLIGNWQTAVTYEFQPGAFLGWGNYFYYGDLKTLPQELKKGTKTLDRWFNTDIPIEKTSGKNPASYHVRVFPLDITSVRADGISVYNANLRRDILLGERMRLELRLDALNVQNRTQFAGPDNNPTSTNFGRVTSGSGAVNRSYQIQAKIQF
jgi:hypothetical protein